jgi:hypothetical protein
MVTLPCSAHCTITGTVSQLVESNGTVVIFLSVTSGRAEMRGIGPETAHLGDTFTLEGDLQIVAPQDADLGPSPKGRK